MINRSWIPVLAILFVGCTNSSDEPMPASTAIAEPSSTVTEDADSATTTTAAEDASEAAAETTTAAEPALRAYDDEPPTTSDNAADGSVYLTRAAMSATSIELRWSDYDGAVEYQLHRVADSAEQAPPIEAMTADNMVHVASDAGAFVDDGVESGVRYWYGLRALDPDGAAIAHGWHPTAAVTDTEPPALVGELSAVFDDGEVLVTWTRPDENYELHGYRVFRSVDGEELETVSTTWRLDQTSFIDDDLPSSGTVTYGIAAFDFHWNESDPALVEVDLG